MGGSKRPFRPIPVEKVKDFQDKLTDFLTTRKAT